VSKYSDTGLIRCARRRVAVASGGTSLAGCSLLFCFVLPTDQPPGIGCGGVSLIICSSSTMIKQRIDESGDQSIHDPLPLSIRSAGPSWMPCMHDALRTGPVQCRGVYIHTVFERCKRIIRTSGTDHQNSIYCMSRTVRALVSVPLSSIVSLMIIYISHVTRTDI
jgi:hypothetical protein